MLLSRLWLRPARLTRRSISQYSTASTASTTENSSQEPTPLRFYGNSGSAESTRERMQKVFGGRVEGSGARESSSRRDKGEARMIAGVLVPDRPKEPDNCCMSGCVNCVWEQYNDDVKDWRKIRTKAAEELNKTQEQWPADFHPPLKALEFKNVPRELRRVKRTMEAGKKTKLSSSAYFPSVGKPGAQNLEAGKDIHDDDDDDWGNVPVAIRVFAETERLMKKKKLEKLKKRELGREQAKVA